MDSVHVTDSVYVLITAEKVTETRWRTQWRERTVHDTLRIHTTDTVFMTQTVEKLVEAPPKADRLGLAAAAIVAFALLFYILVETLLKRH